MYSIKNLLQSAQLRQALTRKAPNAVSATPTPWIAGATFMGKAPSQVATQMQYVAANSIHSSPNMAQQTAVQQAAVPMPWGAVAQPSVAPLGNPAGQPPMAMAPQSIPQQAAAPQTVPQQASLPAMQIPPQIPPQLPTPVVKSGSIYRDLMKKHDRFTQRHLEPAVTYDKVKGGAYDSK